MLSQKLKRISRILIAESKTLDEFFEKIPSFKEFSVENPSHLKKVLNILNDPNLSDNDFQNLLDVLSQKYHPQIAGYLFEEAPFDSQIKVELLDYMIKRKISPTTKNFVPEFINSPPLETHKVLEFKNFIESNYTPEEILQILLKKESRLGNNFPEKVQYFLLEIFEPSFKEIKNLLLKAIPDKNTSSKFDDAMLKYISKNLLAEIDDIQFGHLVALFSDASTHHLINYRITSFDNFLKGLQKAPAKFLDRDTLDSIINYLTMTNQLDELDDENLKELVSLFFSHTSTIDIITSLSNYLPGKENIKEWAIRILLNDSEELEKLIRKDLEKAWELFEAGQPNFVFNSNEDTRTLVSNIYENAPKKNILTYLSKVQAVLNKLFNQYQNDYFEEKFLDNAFHSFSSFQPIQVHDENPLTFEDLEKYSDFSKKDPEEISAGLRDLLNKALHDSILEEAEESADILFDLMNNPPNFTIQNLAKKALEKLIETFESRFDSDILEGYKEKVEEKNRENFKKHLDLLAAEEKESYDGLFLESISRLKETLDNNPLELIKTMYQYKNLPDHNTLKRELVRGLDRLDKASQKALQKTFKVGEFEMDSIYDKLSEMSKEEYRQILRELSREI